MVLNLSNSGQILKVPISIISKILAINRAISPSSDLKVCDWYQETILPKLFKIEPEIVNATRIYRSRDGILLKEEDIQNYLAKKVRTLGGKYSLSNSDSDISRATANYFKQIGAVPFI